MSNLGDLHAEARDHHRKLQRNQNAKTEFTALVQIPKNVENGPLLVKDTKKSFISFVAPNEQGYKVCHHFEFFVFQLKLNSDIGLENTQELAPWPFGSLFSL